MVACAAFIAPRIKVSIEIGTIEQLLAHSYTVETRCQQCKRFGPNLDLKAYAAAGQGHLRPIDLSIKHRECGTVLSITIRPPKGFGK